ncbi:polar amino acid transport system substrate-binding protein [Paenibacillus phyllosphaerae]|uniref:Polar amino acid transport system substrate-binding protein n=1 Tax=Paenibacillus phyllosphaerae TaxID=274593 RepID=A0A7W5FPS0_9BACL|nr:basic amino acid ABC transporter substrate-binding protein [Paenibacillus phyllosphaerae]MBB3112319.1 polar amino acid transport system substrate-binding protein [Paenibacillus phyllosphaerae]
MKKLKLLTVLTIITIILAACGSKNNESGNSNSASGDDVTYLIASDASYAPMEFMDKDKITGFDIDFLAEVMKEAGLKYEVKNVGWDALMESVRQGTEYKAAISAVSITDERQETYDFSAPYFESTNMILVKEGSGIKSATDLKGKKVAVQQGTTADDLMTGIMGQGNTDLSRFENNALALMEMDQGGVDAVVADIAIVREYMKNNPDKNYEGLLDETNFVSEFYGVLLPKGSELKAKLDPAIKTVIENGTYAEVYKKWFGEEPDTAALLSAE